MNAPDRRSDAQDDLDGVPHVSMDCGFLGERESEEHVTSVLVIHERRHKMTWAILRFISTSLVSLPVLSLSIDSRQDEETTYRSEVCSGMTCGALEPLLSR